MCAASSCETPARIVWLGEVCRQGQAQSTGKLGAHKFLLVFHEHFDGVAPNIDSHGQALQMSVRIFLCTQHVRVVQALVGSLPYSRARGTILEQL